MRFLALSFLAFGSVAFAQYEPLTQDFRLTNPVVSYKLFSRLAETQGFVRTETGYKVTLPGLIECTGTLRKRDTQYLCSLLKGGWQTNKETVLSGRGLLELAHREKDGKRLFDALGTQFTEKIDHGVGEDFVTHRVLSKEAGSCSNYEPIILTSVRSYRLEVSKDGQYMHDDHSASVAVMMERPVFECP